jgi:deoxyribonuclease (pyrimidine dimer)
MRINAGILVKNLSDEHLRAEEAEIAMCPGFYNRVWKGKSLIPSQFTLGKGHISFFMNKKSWTLRRYKELHEECIKRGFAGIKDKSDRWSTWNSSVDIDYVPSSRDLQIIKERIISKINNSTGAFHYYRKRIEKGGLIDLLF